MPRLPLAKRYAEAAFQLALEHDQLEKWRDDLGNVSTCLRDDDFRAYSLAPEISDANKLAALHKVLPELDPLVLNLVGLLLKNGLLADFPEIEQAYQDLVDQHQGIERATVTTAVPVNQETIDQIRERLQEITGKTLVVQPEVAPMILGGFIAQVGDQLIDGSLTTRLKELRGKMRAGEI